MFANHTATGLSLLALLCYPAGAKAPQGSFQLLNVSVSQGDLWKINREIEFHFNDPLDPTTVNTNTVQLTDASGFPVLGEFYLRAPRELVFQPACPTQTDLEDGGFQPGEDYTLHVPAGSTTGVLYSRAGSPLAVGASVGFSLPDLNTLPDLFDDAAFGPAMVLVQPSSPDGSFIETGDGDRQYFQEISLGLNGLLDYGAPLNLLSDGNSRVAVHVRLNQPIANFPWNLTMDRIRLEYQDLGGGPWQPLVTEVELIQDCYGGPSTLVLTPQGVLPQGREVRVFISETVSDLVGETLVTPDTYLRFRVSRAETPGGLALDVIDEVREDFLVGADSEGSLEDGTSPLDHPRASWGNGQLSATRNFDGTGGPNGDFDYVVQVDTIFDTTSQVITGGPGGINTHQVHVVNGVLDVRNLWVQEGAHLRFQGPNGVKILASGDVRIDGTISVDGFAAESIFNLNTPTQPAIGGKGNCGGGDGGVGSFLTTAATPYGGPGYGAFGVPNEGGQGGESGWSYSTDGKNRRAAGGGGGRFGPDQFVQWGDLLLVDEHVPGLDAESGFPGAPEAFSSQDNGTHFPYGGLPGPSPFQTESPRDDFFGRARLDFRGSNSQLIEGELPHAWAGSGGGAGGDATRVLTGGVYPPSELINSHHDRGAGGGGGAGSIEIYCLGDVLFGSAGKLRAVGGHGNGGENTQSINRIGGGSGGGSGGHVIIHTGGNIDFSQVPARTIAIDAKGGQGGEGSNAPCPGNHGCGGAFQGESEPFLDGRHVGAAYGHDNPWIAGVFEWQRYWADLFAPLAPQHTVDGAGGDGGPGVIQLHVGNLSGPDDTHNILYPVTGREAMLRWAIRPAPVGYDHLSGEWRDHLLPDIGPLSQAQSKWIPIGVPQAAPNTTAPDLLRFLFDGTDSATGEVQATGGIVDSLPALLAPSNLPESPGLPNLDGPDGIHFDPSGLPLHYQENPSALVGFVVERGGWLRTVQTARIRFDGTQDVLALTMDGAWPIPPVGGPVTLQPRYFRVAGSSSGSAVPNELPPGMSVRVEFQGASATMDGELDPAGIVPGPGVWATDVAALTNSASNADLRFVRFRVTFDLDQSGSGGLLPGSLALELLKLTFLF